jgi:hypothetical protein
MHTHSLATQLRSFMDHIVGARFPLPAVLYKPFEAWHMHSSCDENEQRSFADVYVQVARGGSLRYGRSCPPCTTAADSTCTG